MSYDAIQVEVRDGTERLLALEKFSAGFKKRFYVQVARTRKLYLIESTPPLRIVEKYDTMFASKHIVVSQADYVMATHAKNLGSLWDPTKRFLVTFISSGTYQSMLEPAYRGLLEERAREEARHAFVLSKLFYDDEVTPELWHEFREYKQLVSDGIVNAKEDCLLLDEKDFKSSFSPKKIIEHGFCVSHGIKLASVEWREGMEDLHRHRASLKCIEAWVARPTDQPLKPAAPREKVVFQRAKQNV
tara:strand:+ start:21 stop:755 length:735 start_codon:yes stop_codon:yes gene_type:complete